MEAKNDCSVDLDQLEKLALAATPGPWEREDDEVGEDHAPMCHVGQVDEYDIRIAVHQYAAYPQRRPKIGGPKWRALADQCLANGDFIAAANPQTILALIAMVRAANAEVAQA